MAILDIASQVNRYKGILGWSSPYALEIEMFIKEHPIPVRKPKTTEISAVSQYEPTSLMNMDTPTMFYGSPDALQLQLSGWLITPKSGNQWAPTDRSGSVLNVGNLSYADIISGLITGRLNQSGGGGFVRKDPDYYISPYGHRYNSPIIAAWEPQYSVNMRKQPFSMTLFLEK